MKSTEDRLDAVKGEVISLKMSLQYTQNDVEDLKDKDNSVASTEKKLDALETILDYLENQSRRNNIRSDGIPEGPRQSKISWRSSLTLPRQSSREPIVLVLGYLAPTDRLWSNLTSLKTVTTSSAMVKT